MKMYVHKMVIIGCSISFILMISFPIYDVNSIWSSASLALCIEQLCLFVIFSIGIKSNILMEISYPIGLWLQSTYLFIINTHSNYTPTHHYIGFIMITIWSLRLSIYLIFRIKLTQKHTKHCLRFAHLWENKLRLFTYLIFQYLTIFVNNLSSIAIFYYDRNKNIQINENIEWLNIMSIMLFISGISISTISDYQKLKLTLTNQKHGIWKYSLWRICRRINYVGEMIIFWSVWILSINSIQYNYLLLITICGPIHVTLALLWFSNVFEKNKCKKDLNKTVLNEYDKYKMTTPYFIPFVFINAQLEPKRRVGWGLGMHQIANKYWDVLN
eukprot:402290_1